MKLIFKIIFLNLYVSILFSQTCPNDLQLTGQINSGNYMANTTLNTNATISPNSQVTLTAGNSITLEPGFVTGENVEFLATIGRCEGTGNTLENGITWNNINNLPTNIIAGESYTVSIDYSLTVPGIVYLQVMDADFNRVGHIWPTSALNAGEGTVTLTLTVNDNISSSTFYIQAQLFESSNDGWMSLEVDPIQEQITTTNLNNSIIWNNSNNLPTNITAGESYTVSIDYSLIVPGIVFLQVMDANFNNIGSNFSSSPLNPGEGTETLTLTINDNINSSTFYIKAELFNPDWSLLLADPIQEEIMINSTCPQFAVERSDDPTETDYYPDFILTEARPSKPNDKDLRYPDNTWSGYHTNWFIGNGWRGPIKANWGEVDRATGHGKDFWMEWENIQQSGSSHGELDIKIQKHIYSADAPIFGYPTQVGSLPNNLICTATGQWAPCSKGRGHINLTAWVSTENTINAFDNIGKDGSDPTNEKVDIIIHGWDNSGNMSARDGWDIIGSPTSGGITYDVLQRDGDINEKASFNIVPRFNNMTMAQRAPILVDYPNAGIDTSFTIDTKFFIDWLRDNARGDDENPIFTNDWYLVGLEWTITPQSGDFVDGFDIPASKGGWTFIDYFIPNLNSSSLNNEVENVNIARNSQASASSNNIASLSSNTSSILAPHMQPQVTVSPNPFSNFVTVTQEAIFSSEVLTLLLFDVTGQQLQSIVLKDQQQQISTNYLVKGLYFYQVTNASGQMIANGKIVKP